MNPPSATHAGPRDDRGQPITLLSIRDLKRAEEDPDDLSEFITAFPTGS